MKDNNITIENLFALIARQGEIVKRVKNGGLSILDALSLTQAILDGKLPTKKDNFPQFAHLLRPLSIQATELRNLNKQMPKGIRVPDCWFDENHLDTNSDHTQMIEDLEFFFILPQQGTLKAAIEYQVKLVELTQPAIWRSSSFNSEIASAYLDETADKAMFEKCGIFRRRINLVSYWDSKNGYSVDSARKQASANGILLAGLAAVGAYAAQDSELYQKQDGENLPYFDIADIRSGDDGSHAFNSYCYRNDRRVYFHSCRSDDVHRFCAEPSFV